MALKIKKKILVPSGFLKITIDKILHKGDANEAKPLSKCSAAVRNKYYAVISYLLQRTYTTRPKAWLENVTQQNQCLRISDKRWQLLVGETWTEIRDNLEAAGVLIVHREYSSSRENSTGKPFPMGYRLDPRWYSATFEVATVKYTEPKQARDKRHKKEAKKAQQKKANASSNYWQAIERELAPFSLDPVYALEIFDYVRQERLWNPHQQLIAQLQIETFSNELISLSQGGRIFTDANMIPTELRDALLCDGEETAEIDIRCSQPTIMGSMYPYRSSECKEYLEIVEGDDLYARVVELIGGQRDEAKKQTYRYLFGGDSPDVEAWFKSEFPDLYEIVSQYKKGDLSRELQKREAQLIVGEMMLKSDFSCLSIHDGLRCKASEAESCAAELSRRFKAKFGITPQLTIKYKGLASRLIA